MPRNEAAKKWDKANMTVLACRITREKALRFKLICQEQGTNTNAVLLAYVNEYIKVHEAQE